MIHKYKMKHENLPIACCFLWLQLDQLKQNVKKKHTTNIHHILQPL
jgi:hypothetical protein